MIIIIWSDLKDWYATSATRTLAVFLCGLVFFGFITDLRPEISFQVLSVLGLWLGLNCGKEKWSSARLQSYIYNTTLKPGTVVAGKAVFSCLLSFLHLLFVLPLLLLNAVFSGVTWDVFLQILALFLTISTLASALASFAGNVLTDAKDSLIEGFLIGVYLLCMAIFPALQSINPLVEIHRVFTPGATKGLGFAIISNILLLVTVLLLTWIPYRSGKGEMKYAQHQ